MPIGAPIGQSGRLDLRYYLFNISSCLDLGQFLNTTRNNKARTPTEREEIVGGTHLTPFFFIRIREAWMGMLKKHKALKCFAKHPNAKLPEG